MAQTTPISSRRPTLVEIKTPRGITSAISSRVRTRSDSHSKILDPPTLDGNLSDVEVDEFERKDEADSNSLIAPSSPSSPTYTITGSIPPSPTSPTFGNARGSTTSAWYRGSVAASRTSSYTEAPRGYGVYCEQEEERPHRASHHYQQHQPEQLVQQSPQRTPVFGSNYSVAGADTSAVSCKIIEQLSPGHRRPSNRPATSVGGRGSAGRDSVGSNSADDEASSPDNGEFAVASLPFSHRQPRSTQGGTGAVTPEVLPRTCRKISVAAEPISSQVNDREQQLAGPHGLVPSPISKRHHSSQIGFSEEKQPASNPTADMDKRASNLWKRFSRMSFAGKRATSDTLTIHTLGVSPASEMDATGEPATTQYANGNKASSLSPLSVAGGTSSATTTDGPLTPLTPPAHSKALGKPLSSQDSSPKLATEQSEMSASGKQTKRRSFIRPISLIRNKPREVKQPDDLSGAVNLSNYLDFTRSGGALTSPTISEGNNTGGGNPFFDPQVGDVPGTGHTRVRSDVGVSFVRPANVVDPQAPQAGVAGGTGLTHTPGLRWTTNFGPSVRFATDTKGEGRPRSGVGKDVTAVRINVVENPFEDTSDDELVEITRG